MNRRKFLRGLGFVGAATAAVAPAALAAESPDRFTWNGWEMQWSGWRQPCNQRLDIGFWSAHRGDAEHGEFHYCTTGGTVDTAYRYYTIDLMPRGGWPILDGTHTEADKALARRMALNKLQEHLS